VKKYWPAFLIIAILLVGVGLGNYSCATPQPELVNNRVVRSPTNPELAAAVLTQRHTLDKFIDRYQHPKPGDKAFGVLGRFSTPHGPERAWLHVQSYASGVFTGKLDSDVQADPPLHKGDSQIVQRDNVDDWVYLADGKQQGGLTMAVLQKQVK